MRASTFSPSTDVASGALVDAGGAAGDILINDGTSYKRRAQGAAGTYFRRTPAGSLGYYRRPSWESWDYGWISSNNDGPAYAFAGNGGIVAAGTLAVIGLWLPEQRSITGVLLDLVVVGSTLTAGQNFAGVYDSAGNLIGSSADQKSNWETTTDIKSAALVGGPFAVSPGLIYVAFFWGAGVTGPSFSRAAGRPVSAALASAVTAGARWANANTGLTTALPNTLGALTTSGAGVFAFWAAVY